MDNFKQGEIGQALTGKRKNILVDDIIDKPSLAIYLDCTDETISYYQKEKALPFIPLGRKTYFSVKEVYGWLIERQITLVSEKIEKTGTDSDNGNGKKKEGLAERSEGLDEVAI